MTVVPKCDHVGHLITAGEDTGGFQEWCTECGALIDSGGEERLPDNYRLDTISDEEIITY